MELRNGGAQAGLDAALLGRGECFGDLECQQVIEAAIDLAQALLDGGGKR